MLSSDAVETSEFQIMLICQIIGPTQSNDLSSIVPTYALASFTGAVLITRYVILEFQVTN